MSYDMIDAVITRPQMYTLTGSYAEVIAFLEGYYSGLAKHPIGINESARWSAFRQWIITKLSTKAANELAALHEIYQEQALDTFHVFYQEFKVAEHSCT